MGPLASLPGQAPMARWALALALALAPTPHHHTQPPARQAHPAIGCKWGGKPPSVGLSIADSNSRVQAIIDGQGIALWDRLVAYEINSGDLQYLSDIWLDEYGYYVRAKDSSLESKAVQLFLNWLRDESKDVN